MVIDMVPLAEIKHQYPFMFSLNGLMDEFELSRFQLEDRFSEEIDRLSALVLTIPPKKTEKRALQGLRKLITSASDLGAQTSKPWFSYCWVTIPIPSLVFTNGSYKNYQEMERKYSKRIPNYLFFRTNGNLVNIFQ